MTTVRLPVRIRLELAEDQIDDPDLVSLISSAVDSAATRAVNRARAVHLVTEAAKQAEGGIPAPLVSVCFSGDGLPQRLASELEASMRACAAAVADRLGMPPERRPTLVTAEQGERFDELNVVADRTRPGADAYLIPSYDSRGRPVPVPLRGRPQPGQDDPPTRLRLRIFRSEQELWAAVLSWFRGAPPPRLVAIFGGPGKVDTVGEMAMIDVAADGQPRILSGPINIWQPPVGTGRARLAPVSVYQADTWHFVRRADSESEVLNLRAEIYLDQLRQESGHAGVSEATLQELAKKRARDIPLSRKGPHQFFELLFKGSRVWAGEFLGTGIPTEPRPVVVFTEEAAIDPASHKAASGYGADCPPLETSPITGWFASFGLVNPDLQVREEAFLSEPPIENWTPEIYDQLSGQVKIIAGQLHMSPTRFVGGFLIGAMAHIDKRCRNLAHSGAPMRYQLEEMAGAFGPIRELAQFYKACLVTADEIETLPCPLAGQGGTWIAHFDEVFLAARDDAVASMFVSTCQDVLLQVMISTGNEISRRMMEFPQYMRMTRLLLAILLADTPKLSKLRDKVAEREGMVQGLMMPGGPPLAAWILAQEELLAEASAATPSAGTVVRRNGRYLILDDAGRWWSRAELDSVLSAERQQAVGVDALLDKVADLEDLADRIQAAQRRDAQATADTGQMVTAEVDEEFRALLTQVQKENTRRTGQVRNDRSIAFGLAAFEREDFGPDNDIGVRLSGIHKLADDRLRQAFTDQDAYREGLMQLAVTEISKAEFIEFFTFVGITMIAVFCPPAATVIGAVQALYQLDVAIEHRGIQRAMIGGDEIISKAQAEAEMWGAVIGVALAVLPEVPSLARGGKAILKGEAREAAAAAARETFRRVSAHLAQMSIEHFTKAFVTEAAKMYVMNLALSAAIGRITTAVAEEVSRTGHASIGDLPSVVDRAIHDATADGGAQ